MGVVPRAGPGGSAGGPCPGAWGHGNCGPVPGEAGSNRRLGETAFCRGVVLVHITPASRSICTAPGGSDPNDSACGDPLERLQNARAGELDPAGQDQTDLAHTRLPERAPAD